MYYKSAHAAILVYDITNPGSFEVLEFWMKELHERCDNQKISNF
jgi:Ras-related protein Rab-22